MLGELFGIVIALTAVSMTVYLVLTHFIPPGASRDMFVETYVPPDEREHKKFGVAFLSLHVALFLWVFRAFSWVGEEVVNIEVRNPPMQVEKPLMELSNYAMVTAYLLVLIAAIILTPYVKDKLSRTDRLRRRTATEALMNIVNLFK